MPAELKVICVDGELWHVEWRHDEKVIENWFIYPGNIVPEVSATTDEHGNTVLLTQDNVEVGRYNVRWAGSEVPCGDSEDPNPVPETEWVTD